MRTSAWLCKDHKLADLVQPQFYSFLINTRWPVSPNLIKKSFYFRKHIESQYSDTRFNYKTFRSLSFLWTSISAEYIIRQFVLFADHLRITQWVSQRTLNFTKMDVVSLFLESCDLCAYDKAAIVHFSPEDTLP